MIAAVLLPVKRKVNPELGKGKPRAVDYGTIVTTRLAWNAVSGNAIPFYCLYASEAVLLQIEQKKKFPISPSCGQVELALDHSKGLSLGIAHKLFSRSRCPL